MKEGNYKKSRQRTRILELLRSTEIHPAADWIYEKLKKEFPNLSMGTVYRNLSILQKQGLIKKIGFGSTFDRFDAKVDSHYHFICEECGAIIDLDVEVDDTINNIANQSIPYTVKGYRIDFFGICDNCNNKKN